MCTFSFNQLNHYNWNVMLKKLLWSTSFIQPTSDAAMRCRSILFRFISYALHSFHDISFFRCRCCCCIQLHSLNQTHSYKEWICKSIPTPTHTRAKPTMHRLKCLLDESGNLNQIYDTETEFLIIFHIPICP